MATVSIISELSNQLGRAIVSTRGHHIIVDSPPPLGGPNEELNPLDFLMAALATCGTFVIETAAREMDLPLESVRLEAEGDFDPRGVRGVEGIDPIITEIRVKIIIQGPTKEQSSVLVEQFKARCPVYNTLFRGAPIDLEVV
jgi:putative redox protein